MSDRGEYRPIYTVIVHGADYQQLTPHEKLVLLHCKLNLGASGIGVLYAAVLAEQTGLSDEQVRLAMTTLEHRDWLRVERNVVWVIDGLKYEPSLVRDNPNHRKWVQRHLKGLPNLNIVNAFRARYQDWMDGALGTPADGIGNPSETHPKPPPITTTTTSTKRTTVSSTKRSTPKALPEKPTDRIPAPVYDQLQRTWTQQAGTIDVGRFRKAVKTAMLAGIRAAQIDRAIPRYAKAMRERGRDMKLDWFLEGLQTWIRECDTIAVEVMDPADLGLTPEQAAERVRAHHAKLEQSDAEWARRLTIEVVA